MADLDRLLERTSRTFALSIPQLPEPTRRAITLGYLLFRVADTLEDSNRWDRAARVRELGRLTDILRSPTAEDAVRAASAAAIEWSQNPPHDHEGYMELLGELLCVIEELLRLDPETRAILTRHVLRTAEGMAECVRRGEEDGSLRLRDLPDLRNYCYIVAGIVGELITDTFLVHQPGLSASAETLRANAALFGEGLQMVNILRDASDDAREGRVYLPPAAPRAELFALARADLNLAALYVRTLHSAGAPRGYVAFTALPVLLAFATLDLVEKKGPGVKIGRARVLQLVWKMNRALDQGRSPL